MRIVNFVDGASSETTPTIGNIVASNVTTYVDDATYEASELGAPIEGNLYFNTTLNVIRYYSGASWTTIQDTSEKGIANGYAGLDGTGKVPAAQLPSYVDDVLEFANLAAFPVTGETGKIYVAIDTNKTYRWSGAVYIEISAGGGDLWSDPVNADIVPDSPNTRDLGTLPNSFVLGHIDNLFITDGLGGADASIATGNNLLAVNGFRIRTEAEIPLTIQTVNDSSVDASPTSSVYILTGNKLFGTGDSGDIHAQTGTSAGGARGSLKIKDGTEGNIGDVFTSQTTDGDGAWQAPAAGSTTENVNLDIIGGGTWDFDGTTLTWGNDAYIQHAPFLDDRNTLVAGSIVLADGEVAYVDVNKITDSTTNITVNKAAVGTYAASDDRYVLARRDDTSSVVAAQLLHASNAPFINFTTPTTWWAHQFLTTGAGTLSELKFMLFRDVTLTGPFNMEIHTDSGGSPSGTVLDTITVSAGTVAALGTTPPGVFQSYSTNSTAVLTDATNYWVVFDPNFTAGGALKIEYHGADVYVGDYKSSLDSGATWGSNVAVDLAFEHSISDENVQVGKKLNLTSGQSGNISDGIKIDSVVASANPSLSNLTSPTAINQSLIPAATETLGINGTNWSALWVDVINIGESAGAVKVNWENTAGSNRADTIVDGTTPNGTTIAWATHGIGLGQNVALASDISATSGSSSTGTVELETGDLTNVVSSGPTGDINITTGDTAGSGDSGDVNVVTGTSGSGTRGVFNIAALAVVLPTGTVNPPTSLADGSAYYNTSDDTIRVLRGGVWRATVALT